MVPVELSKARLKRRRSDPAAMCLWILGHVQNGRRKHEKAIVCPTCRSCVEFVNVLRYFAHSSEGTTPSWCSLAPPFLLWHEQLRGVTKAEATRGRRLHSVVNCLFRPETSHKQGGWSSNR